MRFIQFLNVFSQRINTFLERVSTILFMVMTLIVWAQVFFRYVLSGGIVWAEEISKYMMVWMALLGASVVYYENGHIAIEFIIAKFRRSIKWIRIFHVVVALFVFILLIVCGFDYAEFGKRLISPASGLRKFWPYLAIPVGGIFLLLQGVIRLLKFVIDKSETNGPVTMTK